METKKKALGRGLEQLFNSEVLDFSSFESNVLEDVKDKDITEIPIEEIRPNPYQPRKSFNQESLIELAESIKNYGVFTPVIVKKSIKGYDLIAGERRLRASKIAGLTTIPAIVKDFSDEMMREVALLENLQREDLTSIELALAYQGIIDSLGITQEELAFKIGKSRSSVTNTLGLLRLPEDVRQMIMHNDLSMGHARVLSKMGESEEIEKLANKVVKEKLSVRDLEEIATHSEVKKKFPNKKREVSSDYSHIESVLRDLLGTKISIKDKKVSIYFDNASDLNRILDILNVKVN